MTVRTRAREKRAVAPLLLLFLSFAWTACGEAEFAAEKKEKKSEEGSGDAKKPEDETADDPVMVGGAYLTCEALQATSSSPSSRDFACGLYGRKTERLVAINEYTHKWQVVSTQDRSTVEVDGREVKDQRAHFMISYRDESFLAHRLLLMITHKESKKSATFEFELRQASLALGLLQGAAQDARPIKSLGVIDPQRLVGPQVPAMFGCVDRMSCPFLAKSYTLHAEPVDLASLCLGATLQTALTQKVFDSAEIEYNRSVSFSRFGRPCILRKTQRMLEGNGCLFVPILAQRLFEVVPRVLVVQSGPDAEALKSFLKDDTFTCK